MFQDNLEKRSSEHCVKSVEIRSFFWSVFCCIWTEYWEIRSLSVFRPNSGKYGPEKTPYLDTFHAVERFRNTLWKWTITKRFLYYTSLSLHIATGAFLGNFWKFSESVFLPNDLFKRRDDKHGLSSTNLTLTYIIMKNG